MVTQADSLQKQADLGQKRLLPNDLVGHLTSADLGSKSSFSRKFLNKWFKQETCSVKICPPLSCEL
jgi:hypothetical protein